MSPMTLALTVTAFIGLTFVLDVWNTQSELSWIGVGLASMGGISDGRADIYLR